jgi:hypothetical protein
MMKFKSSRKLLALSGLGLVLGLGAASYQAAAEVVVTRTVRFADASSLSTDASGMTFEVRGRPPREYPHVGHRAPFTFEQAARDWAGQHFSLNGNSVNSLRITMREGDIVEKLLPVKKGIKGFFTKDQAAEYEGRIDLEIAVVDPNGRVLAQAEGKAWHTRTIAEGATEADKQAAWAEMIMKTFDDLDLELQPKIRSALAQYVR